jgi:hypothetical protein
MKAGAVDMLDEPCDAIDPEAEKREALKEYCRFKAAVVRSLKKVL